MPRIDPLQLLKCLGVLLTPTGGIRSKEEVQRLASLMMKFSKKLVSKCVYILILKNTETELLGMFMSAGGWTLVFTWLSDGICGKNWALVTELLELLLICPVDVERLKSNSIPRLVKGLSKDESLGGVNVLASRLVEQWLKIVKDETVPDKDIIKQSEIIVEVPTAITEHIHEVTVDTTPSEIDTQKFEISPQTFYKVTVRDGKQVIHKVEADPVDVKEEIVENQIETPIEKENKEKDIKKEERKDKDKVKDNKKHDKSKSHKSSSSSSKSSHSHSSKDHKSSSSSSNKDRDRHKDKDRHRDRDKDRKRKDKDHRSNGAVKTSKDKDKQAEKDKQTLAKIQPQSIDKLGKIPKKSSNEKEKSKTETSHKTKPSISIEVRKKSDGDRPKTVKIFNSKLRSTGLEEAPKPPPSRTAVKKPTATLPSVMPLKRPSPSREAPPPPEKKIKLPEHEEKQSKPGGIKLIPAKPKPAFLQESDMFMDALTASATNKKEPKKRKRKPSISRENSQNSTNSSSPPSSPNQTISPLSSPNVLKSIAPKFYKETLETEETKPETEEKTEIKDERKPEVKEENKTKEEEEEDNRPLENVVKEVNGLRGVLVYHKRRGPKKQVKWKTETELEEVQYFELDETERVNVTKTFMDMKQMEHVGEREALQMVRKIPNEDIMDERTHWKPLIPVDLPPALAEPGSKSSEKAIQFAREKVVLASLYFNRNMLPDTATEPDIEHQPVTDPTVIPLDDATGNPDSVNDYQNTPWPEPKGSPPHIPSNMPTVPGTLFPPNIPFTPQIGHPNFVGIPQGPFPGPGFVAPAMMGGEWRPMTPEGIPDVVNPMTQYNRPENFNGIVEDGNFVPQNFGPGPGPMPGPMYPGFNRGNRGGFRGMNRGGWFRPQGPPPGWHGPRGGGSHWSGRGNNAGICKQFKMQGFCRNRDNCPFMHPQPNGPY